MSLAMLVPIDDADGDPISLSQMRFETKPSTDSDTAGWTLGHACAAVNCGALAALDPTQTYMGTWHDSTANADIVMSVSVDFAGSAVYVKAIMAGPNPPEFLGGLDPEYYISIRNSRWSLQAARTACRPLRTTVSIQRHHIREHNSTAWETQSDRGCW